MPEPLNINPIRPITTPGETRIPAGEEKSSGPSFAEILKNSIKEVNNMQKEADVAINNLALGKTENVTEVLTAVEKADLAFRALMQIRNKLVDAYEEINRLRV